MPYSFAYPLSMVITQSLLLLSTLLLIEHRYQLKKVIIISLGSVAAISAVSIIAFAVIGIDYYYRLVVFLVTLPYFIVAYYLAKNRTIHLLFTYMTISIVGCFTLTNGYVATHYLDNLWANPVIRLLSLGATAYLCYLIRVPYIRLTRTLKKGWLILYFPPAFICLAFLIWFTLFSEARVQNLWFPYALFILGVSIYGIIFLFFKTIHEKSELSYHSQMLNLQMTALKNQLEAQEECRIKTHLIKHDMRHEMQTMAELFRTGKNEEAELMYEKWQIDLNLTSYDFLCAEPYLNATLSIYRWRAENKGIHFAIHSNLPASLDIDAVKLSLILSNSLENAFFAAMKVEPPHSYVKIKLIKTDQHIGFELRNSCAMPVDFDSDGYPITPVSGHGLGTRSIAAYAKEFGSGTILNFSYKDGEFLMQLLV